MYAGTTARRPHCRRGSFAVSLTLAALLIPLSAVQPSRSQEPGTITTIAGNGRLAYGGDGGPATEAAICTPRGLSVDSEGNVYFADNDNFRVRRIDGRTGIVTTVAGSGTAGFSGDGGLATAAELNQPFDAVLDPTQRYLYVADENNMRIRRVDLGTGIITTVVGNGESLFAGDGTPATEAGIGQPVGIAVNRRGDLYISVVEHRVFRVDHLSGLVSVVAGQGAPGFIGDGGPATNARLNSPSGLALDRSGNLYIADSTNARIRRVDPSGTITTVAGSGVFQPTLPILYLGSAGPLVGDGAPAVVAALSRPSGVAVDAEGNLYIADRGHHRVRRVDPSGIITTVAGSLWRGYAGDGGSATDARLDSPERVAFDAEGNLFIAEQANDRIRRVAAPFAA